MSIKQELQTWVDALAHYDRSDFHRALEAFQPISDTSKILFNCGVIHATIGRHTAAVGYYQRATALDEYFAIAYFQQGVSNFLMGDFEEALANFDNALKYLRGNEQINYEQLGLNFTLFSCEIMFNRGLCYVYLQQAEQGMQDLKYAAKEKKKIMHDVIDDAIRDNAEGYTVFSIPVGVVYRPHDGKVKNIFAQNYLGKAQLIATTVPDPDNPQHKRRASMQDWTRKSESSEGVSHVASNRDKLNLSSRNRQQSEPPMSRKYEENEQPPTPPLKPASQQQTPESAEKAKTRSQSMPRRPEQLHLGSSSFHPSLRSQSAERPRITRSVSEGQGSTQYTQGTASSKLQPKSSRPTLGLRTDSLDVSSAGGLPISENSSIRRHFKQRPDSIEEEDERIGNILSAIDPPASTTTVMPIVDYRQRAPSHTRRPSLTLNLNPFRSRQASLERGHSTARQPQARPQATSPTASVQTIRLKIHYEDDTRYIIARENLSFGELGTLITKKFKLKEVDFICKTRDEDGDLITMADQEDLEAAFVVCTERAVKEGNEHLRLEVWVNLV